MTVKNILITTQNKKIPFNTRYYYLGYWCIDFNKKNILNQFKGIKIHKYHWKDKSKLHKDFFFLKNETENILNILSNSLNSLHNTNYDKKYWRTILYPWLSQYVSIIFDRWEIINSFLIKNKSKTYFVYDLFPKNYNYTAKNFKTFFNLASSNHEWNDILFKKIISYRKTKNIIFKKKTNFVREVNELKREKIFFNLKYYFDKVLSKIAFNYNDIIFESFYFPFKEYVSMNLQNNLIPARYYSLFNFDSSNINVDKNLRNKLKNFVINKKSKKGYLNFILNNIADDIQLSYVENFLFLRKKAINFSKKKKIIFTMHSWNFNDFFRIYIAETIKRNKSKLIISDHGGGLDRKLNLLNDYHKKITFKKINWIKKKNKLFSNISLTHPIILKKNLQPTSLKKNLTILYSECSRYQTRVQSIPFFSDEVENFIEFTDAFKKLNNNIKKNIRFRLKESNSLKSDKIFSEIFGKQTTFSKKKSNFHNILINSKIVLISYPTTSLSETLFLNVPSILFCKKDVWLFSNESLRMFEILKKNNMAFDNYNELTHFINERWDNIDEWWKQKNVQKTRNFYLKNFFHISSKWNTGWCSYVNKLKKSIINK